MSFSSDPLQALIDRLAERHVPLIQTVNGQPIVLEPNLEAAERALVILDQQGRPLPLLTLRKWVGYSNAARFRDNVTKGLQKRVRPP